MAKVSFKISSGRLGVVEANTINWMAAVGNWMIGFQEAHNRVASGDSINSYVVGTKNQGRTTTVGLSTLDYVPFALQGRGAGKPPPVEDIEDWIIHKGLTPTDPNTSLSSLAWAIATKIGQEGTLTGTGPDDTKLNAGLIAANVNRLGKKYMNDMSNELADDVATHLFQTLSGRSTTLRI